MLTQTRATYTGTKEYETDRMDAWACWANAIPGISGGILLRIRGICGNSRNFSRCLYQDFSERDLREIGRLLFTNEATADRFADRILEARKKDPEEEAFQLRSRGVHAVCYDDTSYPNRLRLIHNPPYVLYYIGTLPSNERRSLAIIGSRMATPYGREQARVFSRTMAANGVQIISGMARGIDGIAGRAALDAAGVSIAVLGGGPDICYPAENRPLYEDLKNHGCIISEYHPGVEPAARLFPARNRIIAALSDALLVIEAKEKSGTMITVDYALEQGKDVFAVPGRICDRTSRGCNLLLHQGAGIATCPEDLLEYFFGVGQDEDLDQIRLRDLREKRADMIEKRQQAFFVEKEGRGPGFMRQLSLEDLAGSGDGREDGVSEEGQAAEKETKGAARSADAGREPGKGTEETQRKPTAVVRAGKALLTPEEKGERFRKKREIEELPPLERTVLSCLDASTARGLDEILPEVRSRLKRNVAYSELVSGMTRLAIRNLAKEVRIGYYLASASFNESFLQ